jgi:cobalt-zinc-cadmium efflux system protein
MHGHSHDRHGHPHEHEHGRHAHAGTADLGLRAFALGTLVNLGFTALEAGYGLATGSLALLSDALHNLGDALGLALGWGAAMLARRPASARRTYGWRRATLLAPLANSLILVAGAGALGWEAVRRLGGPPEVQALPVIVVAAIGIAVNAGSALLFRHGHAHDLNQRGAYLHLMADAAVSLTVVLGALAMWKLGWRWLDPVLAITVTVVVIAGTWRLLRDSLDQVLDAVPRHLDLDAVTAFLASCAGVVAVHHLHVWALGSNEVALTAHLVRPAGDGDEDAFIDAVAHELHHRFGIGHATLQLERRGEHGDCALPGAPPRRL